MNVLILTPDAVGSTLLQRLITVYMQIQDFDRPIINLHELTNGLQIYWHEQFNQLTIGRTLERSYHQTLPEITDILQQTDHYKISRLACYHILQRNDSLADQVPFYQYLNKHFFIIQAKRKNVFEHAISWCINSVTKRLNVYDAGDKINAFYKFYKDPITIDPNALRRYLDSYLNYLDWSNRFFSIGSVFCYEEHVGDIENYILHLPIFSGRTRITWKECFGINFNDWNKYHYTGSCIDYLSHASGAAAADDLITDNHNLFTSQGYSLLLEEYEKVRDPSWDSITTGDDFDRLPEHIKSECLNIHQLSAVKSRLLSNNVIKQLPKNAVDFLRDHKDTYFAAEQAVHQMQKLNILPGPLPIKKQTLKGKQSMIKNWDQCVEIYNGWQACHTDAAPPYTTDVMSEQVASENRLWHTYNSSNLIGQ